MAKKHQRSARSRSAALSSLVFTGLVAAAIAVQGTGAFAQSAKEVRGATPYLPIKNEPAPRLIVDDPLQALLPLGVVLIQYRVENVHIAPIFGDGAMQVSPRIGHLHVSVDGLRWVWADTSDSNTVDIGNLPPGPHKVTIQLVDANHNDFPGQGRTVNFIVPPRAAAMHH